MKVLRMLFVLVLLFVNLAHADDNNVDLGAIVVESSRSNDRVSNMNKDVSIITSEQIANSSAKNLPELLSALPGVYGIQYGNNKNSQVNMGGFGETGPSNVLVLVDGRRINQIDLSGVDWAQISLDSIERVEVIRGAGTVLYGDNANGGVINIVTKKGKLNSKPSITLFSQWGSYKGNKDGFDVNGGLSKLAYQFNYDHQQGNGYRTNSNYWDNDFNSHLRYDPTDIFWIDFSQGYHDDRSHLPGALFSNDISQFGRTSVEVLHQNDRSWTSDSHFDVTPHLRFDIGNSDGELSLFTSARKRQTKGYFNLILNTPIDESVSQTQSYEFQPKLVVTTPVSDRLNNKFTTGYDYFYAKEENRSGFLQDAGLGFGFPEDLVFVNKVTHGVYVLDEVTLDEKWLFNVGARGSWAQYVFDQVALVPNKSQRSSSVEGFDGGIGYKYNPNSKVYVNYTRSYRLPDTDEYFSNIDVIGGFSYGGLNSTGLTYQTGNEYQWGIRDNTIKDLHLGLNFFADEYKNEIYLDNIAASNIFTNTNYNGRTWHDGVEVESAVDLMKARLQPFVNLTIQQAVFRKGLYSGQNIPFVPKQMANAGVAWKPLEGLSTMAYVNEVGKRFAIGDQTNTFPQLKLYYTVDWNIKYTFKNIEVWFALDNILNKKYSSFGVVDGSGTKIGFYPSPGRNFETGIKLKF